MKNWQRKILRQVLSRCKGETSILKSIDSTAKKIVQRSHYGNLQDLQARKLHNVKTSWNKVNDA